MVKELSSEVKKIKVRKGKEDFVQDPHPTFFTLPGSQVTEHKTPGQGEIHPGPCMGASPHRQDSGITGLPASATILLLPPLHRPVTGAFYNQASSPLSLPE